MAISGGYDIDAWYQAFARAVATEAKAAGDRLGKLVYSEQGVPVVLPIVSPFEDERLYQGSCESLLQELMLYTLLMQIAQDPENPTTSEVAEAEALVGAIAFRLMGFPLEAEENQ